MSYFSGRALASKREKKREQMLTAYIRLLFEQRHGQLVPAYDIGQNLDRVLGEEERVSSMDLSRLLSSMPDIYQEPITKLYYMAHEGCEAGFQKMIKGNLDISCREKVRDIVKQAPQLLTEASKRGEQEVVLRELTAVEYGKATLAEAVHHVLHRLYGVRVFTRREFRRNRLLTETGQQQPDVKCVGRYYLCAQLLEMDENTEERLSQEMLSLLRLLDATPPPSPPPPTTTEEEENEEEEEEEEPKSETESLLSATS